MAINHDPQALALHKANHPTTKHFCEDVFAVKPKKACAGKKVALAWFSPDCTFFSKARGGKPFRDRSKARKRRGLAGVVLKWAAEVKPRVIAMENVEEFQQWCPLTKAGAPDPTKLGSSFRRWWSRLVNLGYKVELRILRGCDYGAPTTRQRLFIIARCDGLPIVWPEPTHGKGRALPHRTAAECIDWSLPCPSIFSRKKPLAENTLKRIARGLKKYVLETGRPFIVPVSHTGVRPNRSRNDVRIHSLDAPMPTITGAHRGEHALIAPTLINTRNGERNGQEPRARDIHRPYPTITAIGSQGALVSAFLAKHYGGHEGDGAGAQLPLPTITSRDHHSVVTSHLLKLRGGLKDHGNTSQSMTDPAPTLTAGGQHLAEVRAFLVKYYGTAQDPQLGLPLHTITTKHRFGLVTVNIDGDEYAIVDIGMRMLEPHELFRAQGFDPGYLKPVEGKPLTKETQVRLVGNSVCPPIAEALVRAQFGIQANVRKVA